MEIKTLEELEGKEIIMCPKCNSQVSTLEENTICKKCSDYDWIKEEYTALVRHQKFSIDINTIKKQAIENMNIKFIQGIPLTRIGELTGLFIREGFDLRNNQVWGKLKRHFFSITEGEL